MLITVEAQRVGCLEVSFLQEEVLSPYNFIPLNCTKKTSHCLFIINSNRMVTKLEHCRSGFVL